MSNHPPAKIRTLLIVDDNKSVCDSLSLILARRGYIVYAASSGPEALELEARNAIDGALVDVNMPGMNGLAVCRALRTRAAEAGGNLPVWMITGARTMELDRAAQEAGSLGVISKPFDIADLFERFDQKFGEMFPGSQPLVGDI